MAARGHCSRQSRQHPRWLVVATALLVLLLAAIEAAAAAPAIDAADTEVTTLTASSTSPPDVSAVQAQGQPCTLTCGDLDCDPAKIKPFNCKGVLGNGWFADWRKQYFDLPGGDRFDNGYYCCTQDVQYAIIPTCADIDGAGTPFDCQGMMGGTWVLNEENAAVPLENDDVLDAITCCTQPVDASDPVDLYLESDSINGQRSSGIPWIVESSVGEQLQVTVNIGVRGLGQSTAKNANMRALLPGFQVLEVKDGGGQACTWHSDCPMVSYVTCFWSKLDRSETKKITLTLRTSDAGGSNMITGLFIVNASSVDVNPDNNEAHLMAQVKAACCAPDGGCQNLSRRDCQSPNAFSPTASCADEPCIKSPSPSRDTGPSGICIRKRNCMERVKQMTCVAQSGRWRNTRTCKNVRIQSLC